MERITKTILHNMINCINTLTADQYGLGIAYGGYRLVKYCGHGGEADCSYRMTAKEMYFTLDALQNVLFRERDARQKKEV